jgi:hypothetical protein
MSAYDLSRILAKNIPVGQNLKRRQAENRGLYEKLRCKYRIEAPQLEKSFAVLDKDWIQRQPEAFGEWNYQNIMSLPAEEKRLG